MNLQLKLESQAEDFLSQRPQSYRHIPDYEPPDLPAWLVHLPEPDGTTNAIMMFAKSVPNPGDKLALRNIWHQEHVVLTAVVLLPIRRIPRDVVLQSWMGAAWADCLFVDLQG